MIAWSGAERDAVRKGPDAARRDPDGAGARRRPILVVDDDESIVETVSAILESEGYDVATASNGQEALAEIDRAEPALVLLDMRMPVLDGWGVARALAGRDRRIPVVVMTAAENARRWAEEISATGYLAKPFELNDLLDAVARYSKRPN